MKRSVSAMFAAVVVGGLLLANASAQSYHRWVIQNNSDQDANDLHLVFDGKIEKAKLRPKTQPPGHDGDGAVNPDNANKTADWAPPDGFGTVAPGGIAYVDVCGGFGSLLNADNSYWTNDGEPLPNFKRRGWRFPITLDAFNQATVKAENNTSQPLHCQNLELWLFNDLENFTIDSYFIPTGTRSFSFPSQVFLNPGQSVTFPIGPQPLGTYVLVRGVATDFLSGEQLPMFSSLAVLCPSDFNRDGFVTGEDFDGFVAQFELGTLAADFDGDGFVTGEDFDAFVAAFESGC